MSYFENIMLFNGVPYPKLSSNGIVHNWWCSKTKVKFWVKTSLRPEIKFTVKIQFVTASSKIYLQNCPDTVGLKS